MESKSIVDSSGYKQLIVIIVLTLIASILPEVIFREWLGAVPVVLSLVKLIILFLAGILFQYLKHYKITKYILVLEVVILAEIIKKYIYLLSFWQKTFDLNSFIGNFGGSILLKIIGIIPVIGILIVLFRSPAAVYITKGDLSIKADEIKWLSIKKDMISWGKLAIISSVLISLGTVMLTIITVTGASINLNIGNLIKYFPFVVILAILNSFCEGIVFRSAILGSLKNILPKNQLIFIAAMIFGIAHYYGAPSGIIGVVMSSLLGWYLCRSMYETKGFISSWIIHFMQDVVIFATILLLGNFY